jgi:hypothetical protein
MSTVAYPLLISPFHKGETLGVSPSRGKTLLNPVKLKPNLELLGRMNSS